MTAHLAEFSDNSNEVTAVAEMLADCVTIQSEEPSVADSWKVVYVYMLNNYHNLFTQATMLPILQHSESNIF